MKLPEAFKDKMLGLLGEKEYGEFIEALSGERQYGLRVNRLKVGVEDFRKLSPFELEPVPWTDDGFYISGEDAPGRHPYYHAGLYYIQEPSAMLPGQILGAKPGERILDLCAAPGGKTVQIAASMQGKGLLFSNDINTERVKALVKNIELCGIKNAIVLNESPEKLINNFEGYFDRILIDAPCSGEGMFRKDEAAARSWESFKCERCTKLQEPILRSADRLLKPGGTLVYSTCTFSPEEDERMIAGFLKEHSGYVFAEIPKIAGIEGGRPEWLDGGGIDEELLHSSLTNSCSGVSYHDSSPLETNVDEFRKAARLWPHRVRGEGHFVVKLFKTEGAASTKAGMINTGYTENSGRIGNNAHTEDNIGRTGHTDDDPGRTGHNVHNNQPTEKVLAYKDLPESFGEFVKENMNEMPEGVYLIKGHNLYQLPEQPPSLDSLKVAKFGWFLGTFEGNRFEPSHSIVTALGASAFKRVVDLAAGSREIRSYLKGETLIVDGEKGLTAVCVDGYTVGWAKQAGDMLKNLYPKGWRRLS
ncbi:MAG TPA: RsmB/NOP family class I SAM-dependent RNA methyltransferase [Clostridia bacterium]|nr:RsmB/NOP family class I SAM-dependent RNA methyltransferase [Clostridia bacterium]